MDISVVFFVQHIEVKLAGLHCAEKFDGDIHKAEPDRPGPYCSHIFPVEMIDAIRYSKSVPFANE
ncbi:hypothetical protein D3C86_2205580 [compost metagenome]